MDFHSSLEYAAYELWFRSLNGKASIINPVIKQTLFYRLQSSTNLFRTGKKNMN